MSRTGSPSSGSAATSPTFDRRTTAREDVVAAITGAPPRRWWRHDPRRFRHVPMRVLVLGGGVAGLETCLALRASPAIGSMSL